jgi:dTDP-4-dehydrorhamnose 3,5-epimerase
VIFNPTTIAGAYVIEPEPLEDERGFFARVWSRDEFASQGLTDVIAQCSVSFNRRAGTLRGLHWQAPPHAESKLVRCIRGAVYDVLADVRRDSPSSGRWEAFELTADNRRLLYVPPYVAHGFQTLADETEIFYAMSTPYVAEAACGVRWDDPAFAIAWPPPAERVIVDRDLMWPDWDRMGEAAATS